MFRQIRYQTGEITEILAEMSQGRVPCMDVNDPEELEWFLGRLAAHGMKERKDIPRDRNARDRLKEPEFEFRVAFSPLLPLGDTDQNKIIQIDFYYEPEEERTYDSILGD